MIALSLNLHRQGVSVLRRLELLLERSVDQLEIFKLRPLLFQLLFGQLLELNTRLGNHLLALGRRNFLRTFGEHAVDRLSDKAHDVGLVENLDLLEASLAQRVECHL